MHYECAGYSECRLSCAPSVMRPRCCADESPQGDFEAIAYQAFSIARTTSPTVSRTRDWSSADDIRAAEAELRSQLQLVAQDASRPWLWLFKPTTVDKAGQNNAELPEIDGYRLQRASPHTS